MGIRDCPQWPLFGCITKPTVSERISRHANYAVSYAAN